MPRNLTPLTSRWSRWVSGLVLIATGCAGPLAPAVAAPQTPPGAARIWFYRGYEPPVGYSGTATPTIVANGTSVGPAADGSVFYRDVPPGHYDVNIQTAPGYRSAHFDIAAGQQAYVKIVVNRGGTCLPWQHESGFSAMLVSQQLAQTEIPSFR